MRHIQSGMAVLFKPLRVWALPVHLILEPTTFCPLSCRMCKRAKYVTSPKHMTMDEFRIIFDQIKPLRLTLSGLGESLVNPALVDMIHYAGKKGTAVSTTSSMALTDIPVESLVKSGLKRLKVSLDAATPEIYQEIRGLDRFDRVIDNIKAMAAMKQKTNTTWLHICLQVVIQSKNVSQLSQIVELAADLGVDAVSFRPVGLAGIEEKRDELVAGLTPDIVVSQMKRARDTAGKVGMKTNLDDLLTGTPWDVSCDKKHQNTRHCSFPWFSMYITVDGEVKPCCMFSYIDAGLGNLLQENIHTVWNSVKYQEFRQVLRHGGYPDARCRECVPEQIFSLAGMLRRIRNRE